MATAYDTNKGRVHFFDDFLGDAINLDMYSTNSDSGGTAFALNVQANGVIRGGTDGTDSDITNIFGEVIWRPDAGGPLTLEVRAALITSVADGETFIGFSDAVTDETPLQVSTTDVASSSATDGCGFAYTGAGTANWKAVGVNNGTDATPVACNNTYTTATGTSSTVTTPVAATFQTFKVVVNEDGDADYYINGAWQARIDAATRGTVLHCFAAAIEGGGTARSLDIDYVEITGGRYR